VIHKAEGAAFRCTLDGSQASRWLEIPAWMFDRTACPGDVRFVGAPFVSLEALSALSTLLDPVLKNTVPSSNVPLLGSCQALDIRKRGEAHGIQDEVGSNWTSDREPGRFTADGSVQGHAREGKPSGPAWPDLPEGARDTLIGLITQLILEHVRVNATLTATEGSHDR
jgi:hypothetical protein